MIDFLLRPFRRNFGKDKVFYAAIDDMFGFIPNNIELYKLALIHKSASVVTEDGRQINNERLEYLGDAVLETVTSDYLFIEYPDMNEGFLTQLRSKMVSRQTLNDVAKRIGLDDYVISHTSASMSQKHIYGDAFEAMMGAIYLDQGYDFVNRLLINNIFAKYIKADNLADSETDFKSRLIEWCQKNHHSIRFSTHNDKSYSSSHPFFYCKVLIDGIEVGYGAGDSKKEAEQRAAYSVAQGVSDADCTKLMDRLDTLETKQLQKSATEKKTVIVDDVSKQKEAKKGEQISPEKTKELGDAQKHKTSVRADVKVAVKSERKIDSRKEGAVPAKDTSAKNSDNNPEDTAAKGVDVVVEAKPKSRRGRTKKSAPTSDSNEVKSEAVEPAVKEKAQLPVRKPKAQKSSGVQDESSPVENDGGKSQTASAEKTIKSVNRRPKTRSKAKSATEQTLSDIAADAEAIMSEVEQLKKIAQG